MPENYNFEERRILIVDDEETLTWSMTKTLAKDKDRYELIVANNGTDALAILEKTPVDVVVTDIRMPDINGLDLLSMIREKYPYTKVIIMTAYGSPEVHKEATRRGSYYYLEKPFEISEIRSLILKALEERRGGFVGQVVDLQLVDIIQMACLGRFTMSLAVSKGNEGGIIYFQNGEIVHCELGDLEGKEALYTILGWNEGRFNSQMGVTPPKTTITERWEHLLMEGMRRRDEAGEKIESESTVLLHEVEQAFENLNQEVALKELLGKLLTILNSIDGFQKGIWIDTEGNVISSGNFVFNEKESFTPLLMQKIATRIGMKLANVSPLRINVGLKNAQLVIMLYGNLIFMAILQGRITASEFLAITKPIFEKHLSSKI